MEKYTGYVGAPYNFIEMNKKVYEKKELQPHDEISPRKHTGVIEYELEAKTPIMIDDGKEQFSQNAYGEDAIPGSTMRGLVRSNMQILSFSSVVGDIQNGKMMYRNVANGKDKERYNTVLGNKAVSYTAANGKRGQMSVLRNVRAGYIRNDNNRYFIVPTVVESISKDAGDMNYYVLNERKIIESKDGHFKFLLNQRPYIMQNNDKQFRRDVKGGRVHYRGDENKQYHPYFIRISYEVSGVRQISGVAEWGKLSHNGYLISTGKMQEKKAIYVIPEIDESKEIIPVPPQDIDNFKRDYESRKNQVEAMEGKGKQGFFSLPENGETKPVFYIYLDKKLYFGFTPRLRIFYDKEIYDGVYASHKNVTQDYCQSIFGYSRDKESYKSRVSFMDAVVYEGQKSRKETRYILGTPKPTSYLDYLTNAKNEAVSYNDDFEIRGVKQYWLKKTPDPEGEIPNPKTASTLHPYETGTRFKGRIRFDNLSDEELGMLLWSLLLDEKSNQNIGKAKAYGYGRIAVKLTGLELLDYQKLYSTASLSLNPYVDGMSKVKELMKAAKDDMTAFLGHDIMTDPRIRHFFMMKDVTLIPNREKTRYMSISSDKKEYQNRVSKSVKLPTVEDVITGKDIMYAPKTKNNQNQSGGKPKNNNSYGTKNQNNYNPQGKKHSKRQF